MNRLFNPVAWSLATNLYEVNIRQYTSEGTFVAFEKHLPRLRNMGVETLWFMPITPISLVERQGTLGSYYACSDYTSVNPEFGTLNDFRKLVMEAHKLGFKVIIDWVANHTGWDHHWTTSNPEFYKKNAEGKFYDNNNWHDVIDLNYYDGAMRNAMIAAMQFWVNDCGIDGFRCDMAHLVPLDFWSQARVALDSIRPLFWLAETEDYHYLEVFDCCYAWQWMHDTEKYCKGGMDLFKLKSVLSRYESEFPSETTQLFFTSNHDENSWNGTEYEKYGNAAKVFAVFNCLWQGLPLMYSGQELPNKKRLKFFDKDLIEWNDKPELQDFYKTLLRVRANNSAINQGKISKPIFIPVTANQNVFAFMRRNSGSEVVVLLNLSPNHTYIQLPDGYVHGTYTSVFNGARLDIIPNHSFELNAWDYMVLEK